MTQGMFALANPYGQGVQATYNMNNQFDLLGCFCKFEGTVFIEYPDINDEPQQAVKKTSWKAIGIGLLVAVAAVAVAAVAIAAAPVTGGASVAAFVVGAIKVGAVCAVVAGAVNIGEQMITKGDPSKIDWGEVAVSALFGFASGALTCTPIGVGGLVVANGLLGGGKQALLDWDREGKFDPVNVSVQTVLGMIIGALGGNGSIKALRGTFHAAPGLYIKDAIKGSFGKGFFHGIPVNFTDEVFNAAKEKAEDLYEKAKAFYETMFE